MEKTEIDDVLSDVAGQFFDVTVNPLAAMICSLLNLMVQRGMISKDEAKGIIASTVDVINESNHSDEILSNGHDMLMRMISAIDKIPNSPN